MNGQQKHVPSKPPEDMALGYPHRTTYTPPRGSRIKYLNWDLAGPLAPPVGATSRARTKLKVTSVHCPTSPKEGRTLLHSACVVTWSLR